MGRRWWLNVREKRHAFEQTRVFVRNTCLLLAQSPLRTCGHPPALIALPGASGGAWSFPPVPALSSCIALVCGWGGGHSWETQPVLLTEQMGCPAPSWPHPGTGGQPHPLPLLQPSFWGVRGIPGARETQALAVPHQQRYVPGCRQGFISTCRVSPALRLVHRGAGWCFKCPGLDPSVLRWPCLWPWAMSSLRPPGRKKQAGVREKGAKSAKRLFCLFYIFCFFFPEFFNSGQKWSKGLDEELSEASLDEGRWKKKGLEKQNTCFVTELPFHRHVEGSMLRDPPESMGYSGQLGYQGIKLSSFCSKATCCVAVVLLWGINSALAKPNTLHGGTGFLHLERAWFWDTGKHHHFLLSTLIWLSQLLAVWTCKWHFL